MGRDWNVSFLGSHVFKRVNKHERAEKGAAVISLRKNVITFKKEVLSFKSNRHIYSQTQLSLPYTHVLFTTNTTTRKDCVCCHLILVREALIML